MVCSANIIHFVFVVCISIIILLINYITMLNNCDILHKFKHICIVCQFYYINLKFCLSLSSKNRKMHCKLFFYFSVQLNIQTCICLNTILEYIRINIYIVVFSIKRRFVNDRVILLPSPVSCRILTFRLSSIIQKHSTTLSFHLTLVNVNCLVMCFLRCFIKLHDTAHRCARVACSSRILREEFQIA